MNTNKISTQASNASAGQEDLTKPFVKKNFIYMAGSLAMIIVGFLLMTGTPNGQGDTFNADIFSTRRIVVGPALAFLGFVAMAFAILYTPRKSKNITTEA